MSRSTAYRQRLEARAELSTSIREHWTSSKQTSLILHWDSKAITYVDGKTDERLAVLVTVVGISSEHKLLCIPMIPHSTGWAQKEAIIDLVRQWDIEGNVVGMTIKIWVTVSGRNMEIPKLDEQKAIEQGGKIVRGVIFLGIAAAILAIQNEIRMKDIENQEEKHRQIIEVLLNEKMTNFTKDTFQLITDFHEDEKKERKELRELILLTCQKPAAEGHTMEK